MGFLGFGRKANEVVVKREDLVRVQSMIALLAERCKASGDTSAEGLASRALTSLLKLDSAVDLIAVPECALTLRAAANKRTSKHFKNPRIDTVLFETSSFQNNVLDMYMYGLFDGWFDDVCYQYPEIMPEAPVSEVPMTIMPAFEGSAIVFPAVVEEVINGAENMIGQIVEKLSNEAEVVRDSAVDVYNHVNSAAEVVAERTWDAVDNASDAVRDKATDLIDAVRDHFDAPVTAPEPTPAPVYEAPAPAYEAPTTAYEAPSSYDSGSSSSYNSGGSSYDSGSSGGGGDW